MPFPPDRKPHVLEQQYPAAPHPPLNFSVQSGLETGTVDLRWTSPAEISSNTKFDLVGVNVYRSFDSEFGPYFRMNTLPVGATFWRDMTTVSVALREDVSKRFVSRGDRDPSRTWVFRTANNPIVLDPVIGGTECPDLNVFVTVNGVRAWVRRVVSYLGEVELEPFPTFDVASQQQFPAVLPTGDADVVLATYRYVSKRIRTDLGQRIFYRITTVARDRTTGQLIETALDRAAQGNNQQTEQLDWIWREAVRRNRFLLVQGGERAKVFICRRVGPKCGCSSDLHRQPSSDCLVCYATGVIGGYDGPYDVILSPDDAEKKKTQNNRGRTMEHSYETWCGPNPLLSQRDFIVKLNGDRYGIGPVRMPTARGMQLQQMFTVSHLDEQDIRSKVPVLDTSTMESSRTRYIVPGEGGSTPMVTERQAIPDEREFRGNTVAFENAHRR